MLLNEQRLVSIFHVTTTPTFQMFSQLFISVETTMSCANLQFCSAGSNLCQPTLVGFLVDQHQKVSICENKEDKEAFSPSPCKSFRLKAHAPQFCCFVISLTCLTCEENPRPVFLSCQPDGKDCLFVIL